MVSLIRKNIKIYMERKWTDRHCHVQDNADVAHQYMKIYCNTNKFPELSFCGSHSKLHWSRGLSKNYHLVSDPKIGNGVYEILCIYCARVACKSILYKPWISGIPRNKQRCYKPVTKGNSWPVLGSLNNWYIIQF